MKKILVISNMYPSKNHPTFGIFVKNQVESLRSQGLTVDVISNQNPEKGKVNLLSKYLKWFIDFKLYLLKNLNRISLIHAHYVFPTGALALMAKYLFKIPFAVTAHGGDLDQMAKKHPIIQKLTKKILKEASAVIVVGAGLKNDVLNNYGIREDKIHVLSMGVNTKVFKNFNKLDALNTLNLPSDTKKILYVGNVIRNKGIIELVEAFVSLQAEYSLYLVGSTKDEGFVKEVKHMIKEKSLVNTHFVPPQTQSNLALWMNACDTLVLPSYHEGFGLVALEGLASGIPVVATDVGGLPSLLENNRGILIEERNSLAIVDGIQKAMNASFNQENIDRLVYDQSDERIIESLKSIYKNIEQEDL